MHFAEEQTTLQMEIGRTDSPVRKAKWTLEAVAYREELESLQNKDTILQEELYLEKITQLFFRKKLNMLF